MDALFYVMAVFGCADGGSQCQEARLASQRFSTQDQCERAADDVLMRSTDVGAPTIVARCMTNLRYVSMQTDERAARLRLATLR